MKAEACEVAAFRLTELDGLDPVDVYLRDLGPGKGILTISCFSSAWSSWWGGMGNDTPIRKFLAQCSPDYLTGCLLRGDLFHERLTKKQRDYLYRICQAVISFAKGGPQ